MRTLCLLLFCSLATAVPLRFEQKTLVETKVPQIKHEEEITSKRMMMTAVFSLIGRGWEQQPRDIFGSRGWNIGSIVGFPEEDEDHVIFPLAWGLNSVGLRGGWAHGERLIIDILDSYGEMIGKNLKVITENLELYTNLQPCWMCTVELAVRAKFKMIYFTMLDKGKSDSDKVCLNEKKYLVGTKEAFAQDRYHGKEKAQADNENQVLHTMLEVLTAWLDDSDNNAGTRFGPFKYDCDAVTDEKNYIIEYLVKDDAGFLRNERSRNAFKAVIEGTDLKEAEKFVFSETLINPLVEKENCVTLEKAAFKQIYDPDRRFPQAFIDQKVEDYYRCIYDEEVLQGEADTGKVFLKHTSPYSTYETGKRNGGFFTANIAKLLEASDVKTVSKEANFNLVKGILERYTKLSDTQHSFMLDIITKM